MKKLVLNPNEIAVRKVYWPLIAAGKISTFFRPGVRLCADYRGYCKKQAIILKCIKQLGSDQLGIGPLFSNSKQIAATIDCIYSKKIGELTESDFYGSSPDVQNAETLKFHLGLIYNLSLDELTDETYVTIIRLRYDQKTKSMNAPKKRLENLTQNGLWRIAKLPPANPHDFFAEELMVTLVNHDYPARTPLLWNSTFTQFKIPAKSLVLAPGLEDLTKEELAWTLDVFREDSRFMAGGLGVGFKDDLIGLLDVLDESAADVGAANFVRKDEKGRLVGYNTDGNGFAQGLQENFSDLKDLSGKRILLLGSGGTANAIAFALSRAGAKLIIANRTEAKAVALAEKINDSQNLAGKQRVLSCGETDIKPHLGNLDLIINASIKGAAGEWEDFSSLADTSSDLADNLEKSRQRLNLLPKHCVVADIILRTGDTPLITQAKQAGLRTMDGLPMVLSQAALAFTLSYGLKLEIEFGAAYAAMKQANK